MTACASQIPAPVINLTTPPPLHKNSFGLNNDSPHLVINSNPHSQHNNVNSDIKITDKQSTNISTQQWIKPTEGIIIIKFSARNKGIDIKGILGQPIRATNSGLVVYSGNGLKGYGNLIIIKHSNLYLTAYAYNQKNLVKSGQKVKQGQTIATMGEIGPRQAQLHFEIRKNGNPINPLIMINLD